MKVTVLLKNDHETMRVLFGKIRKASGSRSQNGKKDLFNELRREFLIHSQMEQEIFYPALSATSSTRAAELVSKAEQEHQAAEKLMHELNSVNGSDKSFETRVTSLIDQMTQHMEMEEEEIFDEARKNLPEYRLEELGLEMEDRKKILGTLAA